MKADSDAPRLYLSELYPRTGSYWNLFNIRAKIAIPFHSFLSFFSSLTQWEHND